MAFDRKKILKFFTWKRLLFPVLLGLGVAIWLTIDSFEIDAFKSIHWGFGAFVAFTVALLLQAMRDFAYMIRIKVLTDNQLTWRQSFQVIMMWEFASALTPSIVGGSAVALFIVAQEGISPGRSTAIVLITAFLDEMFYLIMVPIIVIVVGFDHLFDTERSANFLGMQLGIKSLFYVGYVLILVLNCFIAYGIFINPKGLKKILGGLFSLKFLRKWKPQAIQAGDDIITTSKEMRKKPFMFWIKTGGATFLSWTSRFLVVNFLILAIGGSGNQWFIYAKQLVMWIILMISPTPGASGVAEYFFSDFLGAFIPHGLSSAIAILWRLMSYYVYLILGLIVLPLWLRRVFSRRHLKRIQEQQQEQEL
ncbi:MAG: flippase-like domain-containing protein [Bacteroidales bacterium]|jgi:uncharacterized protein (TIRG00374 family)|nr:flippase-like domain-containing protein [Bacteroidales bacterium]